MHAQISRRRLGLAGALLTSSFLTVACGPGNGGSSSSSSSTGTPSTGSGGTSGSSSNGTSGTSGTTSTAFTTFCNQLLQAEATYEGNCLGGSPAYWEAYFGSADACGQLSGAIAAGRADFNPAQSQACLSALSTAPCSGNGAMPSACSTVLSGTVGANGACYQSADCQTGLICTSNASTCPGVCAPLTTSAGQPCGNGCGSGLYCANGSGSCQPLPTPVADGQPCDSSLPLNADPCMVGECLAVVYPDGGLGFSLDGGVLGACGQPTSIGQSCSTGTFCELDSYCSPSTGQCTALAAMGAPCGTLFPQSPFTLVGCAPGLYCTQTPDAGGACAAQLSPGAACNPRVNDSTQCGLSGNCSSAGMCTSGTCLEP